MRVHSGVVQHFAGLATLDELSITHRICASSRVCRVAYLLAVEVGKQVVLRLAGGHPGAVGDLGVVPLGDLVQRLTAATAAPRATA